MTHNDCGESRDERKNLPIDSDIGVGDARPSSRKELGGVQWSHAGIVLLGGMAGSGLREVLNALIPDLGAFPLGILLINLSGSFALGLLLDVLLCAGGDEGRRRTWRLFLGTGFLGGFTTYSALAIGAVLMVDGGDLLAAVIYVTASVIVGPIAALLGIASGHAIHRGRKSEVRV